MAATKTRGKGNKKNGERQLSLDQKLARALANPTRVRMLAALQEKPASASELEDVLEIPLSNLSYHMKRLYEYGCVEIAKKEPVRGAMKTKYRAITRMMLNDGDWAKLSAETKNGISIAAVEEVITRASEAVEHDTFDSRDDRHVITLKPDLDERGWSDSAKVIEDAYKKLCDIECEAVNRTDTDDRFPVTISMLSYESPRAES